MVGDRTSPEPLLSSRVPELQLDADPRLHLQEVHVEVHPDRLVHGLLEHVVSVALQQGGLAHRGVAQHDDPELVLPQGQVHRRWQWEKNGVSTACGNAEV